MIINYKGRRPKEEETTTDGKYGASEGGSECQDEIKWQERESKERRERVEQVDKDSNWDTTHGNQEGSMQRTLLPEDRQQSEAIRLNHFMSEN